MEEEKDETPAASPPVQKTGRASRRFLNVRSLAVLVFVALAVYAVYWWLFQRNFVSTDDAYARADSAQISPRIAGTVLKVFVENDVPVEAGQILVTLDPEDYRIAVEKAMAVHAEDVAQVSSAEVGIGQTETQTAAQVQAAEAALKAAQDKEKESQHLLTEAQKRQLSTNADLAQAKRDYERYSSLYKQGAGTGRQMEQAQTNMKKLQAQEEAESAQISSVGSSLSALRQEVDRAKAQLRSAVSARDNVQIQEYKLEAFRAKSRQSAAELEAAKLNLAYCSITAPIPGYIAQKNVQVGDRLQTGQPIMAVVPLRKIYIEANFKETQLKNVRMGQPATISADIYPGHEYKGTVIGIRAGTGAAFSLLPAENATGNWVKVVQRVPVKIELNEPPPADKPLRVGLSVDVDINTADKTGKVLVPTGAAESSTASSQQGK